MGTPADLGHCKAREDKAGPAWNGLESDEDAVKFGGGTIFAKLASRSSLNSIGPPSLLAFLYGFSMARREPHEIFMRFS